MSGDGLYEDIPSEECNRLLSQRSIGRLAGIHDGKPFVFPVNYVLERGAVVFRTDPGTKLTGSALGPVAFEIDGVDEADRTGWSVVVQGIATEITEAVDERSEALRRLAAEPWAPGDKSHWVAITADEVTGRRLRRH